MPNPKKEATVIGLRDEVDNATGVVIMLFSGLSVPAITDLRGRLRKAEARMFVVKNRLLKLALAGGPLEPLTEVLTGQNAVVFCQGDMPPAVKVITEFAKDYPGVSLKAGYMEGAVFDQSQTEALSTIPSKPELLSQVVGALNSPITGLVFSLKGILSDFVYTLQAVADKQGEASAA